MNNPINKQVFDTRDLIEYKEHLEETLIDNYNSFIDNSDFEIDDVDDINNEEFEEKNNLELEEYNDIKTFCGELEDSPDFQYGESVIHESYFTEYTEDFLIDCGYIPKDLPYWIEIDMEATAENVKQDYTEVEFEGDFYYIRS